MNQYDVWGIPEDLSSQKKSVVFVKTHPLEEDEEQSNLVASGNLTYSTTFQVNYKGQEVKTYYIYLLERMPVIPRDQNLFVRY